MSEDGAKGRQTCAPSGVSGSSTDVTARGVIVICPCTRLMTGGPLISLMSITKALPFQCIDDGPTCNVSVLVRSACRPRSVMVNRPPRP